MTGEPLTVEKLRSEYRKLLDAYFGPKFTIDPELELECLRIPHFYRAFYVYKYATGLSAATLLALGFGRCARRSAAVRFQEQSVLRRGGVTSLGTPKRECAEENAQGDPEDDQLSTEGSLREPS